MIDAGGVSLRASLAAASTIGCHEFCQTFLRVTIQPALRPSTPVTRVIQVPQPAATFISSNISCGIG